VQVESDAEVLRLRSVLRDLVALSAIPAVWVGREPSAVATGLADALVGMLGLDFAFVRLSDASGTEAVEVSRGNGWKSFPEWLQGHLATTAPFPRKEVVPDVGDDSALRRGLVVPIGVNGEGGVVAAASERSDFPTPVDEVLLSTAANHAATAFQGARLIHERTRAEDELRKARDELEAKVAERTSQLEQLANEQAGLRRVATLVAQGAPAETLIAVVAEQVAEVLAVPLVSIVRYESDGTATERASFSPAGAMFRVGTRWSVEGTNVVAHVRDSGRPARIDDHSGLTGMIAELVRNAGIRSTVGIPIVVAGRLWGAMVVSTTEPDPLPADTEVRLADFTELAGTAIANTEAQDEVRRLADEQAALRRVATLVAREASQTDVFTAIAREIGQLLGTEEIRMVRYVDDSTAVVVAGSGDREGVFPDGTRLPLGGDDATSRVYRTGGPARIDEYGGASGVIAAPVRAIGIRSVVGVPILVEGGLWGAMITGTAREELMPRDTEARLGQFTELMATAIANTETRARADRLAEEQAALRRVATLVAKEAEAAAVFAKVVEEVSNVLDDVDCSLFRDEGDGTATVVAVWGANVSAGVRVGAVYPVDGDGAIASAIREARPIRIGDYTGVTGPIAKSGRELGIRSAVACPILVRGRVWGAMGAARYEAEAFPPEAENRMTQFAELVATAISNAEARIEVERLAEEQAALRRVATLVAEGAAPPVVLDAVAAEMEALLDADQVALNRFEPGDEILVLAHRGLDVERTPVGTRLSTLGESVTATVRRTGRPARMEGYEHAEGAVAELARATGLRSSVSTPIVVDGRLWGVITASWKGERSASPGTEDRMTKFAELLDTAIANADTRDQLTASRARLLTEGDEARRRVVRDLHDGAQQRLVHAIVTLKLAKRALRQQDEEAESLVGEALRHAEQGNAELRELAHGILPSVLTDGGLRAGIDTFVGRLDVPVRVDVPEDRLPAEIEASAYFIVAEALTNVVKHSKSEHAEVRAFVEHGTLRLEVRDDGIGGADPHGHGLVGLGDRVTALGGRLEIESPPGGGTLLAARLPLTDDEHVMGG
jgi:signal transduction histidine kinase